MDVDSDHTTMAAAAASSKWRAWAKTLTDGTIEFDMDHSTTAGELREHAEVVLGSAPGSIKVLFRGTVLGDSFVLRDIGGIDGTLFVVPGRVSHYMPTMVRSLTVAPSGRITASDAPLEFDVHDRSLQPADDDASPVTLVALASDDDDDPGVMRRHLRELIGQPHPGSTAWDASSRRLVFSPSRPLQASQRYGICVRLHSTTGTSVAPWLFSFRTCDPPESLTVYHDARLDEPVSMSLSREATSLDELIAAARAALSVPDTETIALVIRDKPRSSRQWSIASMEAFRSRRAGYVVVACPVRASV